MLGQKLRNKANTQQQSKSVDFSQNLPCHISYKFLIIKIKILILRLYLPYCVSLCSTLSFFGFPDIVHVSAICIVPIARIVSEEGHFLWRMYYLEGATPRIIKTNSSFMICSKIFLSYSEERNLAFVLMFVQRYCFALKVTFTLDV